MSIDPANVKALVVGIEKYEWGRPLNGPAGDALSFASWLLEKGVQPSEIKVFLSPLDSNASLQAEAEAKGLSPKPATRENINRVVVNDFLDQGGKDKLLYVFWAGHGFITKTGATVRRLFFADTDSKNKWNLHFDSLLEAFQTSQKAGVLFSTQVFFIDACASAMFEERFYKTLQVEAAELKFATSGIPRDGRGTAKQYSLFAAPEYETATNLADEGTGQFSKAVLEELESQPLLPDMPEIALKIQRNFQEKQLLDPVFWAFSIGGSSLYGEDKVAQRLQDASENSTVPAISMSIEDRLKLVNTLNALSTAEFEKLLIVLNPNPGVVPPTSASQGIRSAELLRWVEGPTGPGLNQLQAVLGLGKVMVPVSQTTPHPELRPISETVSKLPKQTSGLKIPDELSLEEWEALVEALASAFLNRELLESMVRRALKVRLDDISQSASTYTKTVEMVVDWAQANGKLQDLVEGALKINTGSPKLKSLAQSWGR